MSITPEALSFDDFVDKYCERQCLEPDRLKQILSKQKEIYQPDGWMMLECQMLDSTSMGRLVILPYGPNNTFQTLPASPVSPNGLASDMSTVVAVLTADMVPDPS